MNSGTRLRLVRGIVYSFFLIAIIILFDACNQPFDWSLDMPSDWTLDSATEDGASDQESDPAPEEEPILAEPQAITLSGQDFSLYWDEATDPVAEYRVYHRSRGSTQWELLASGLHQAEANITLAELSPGSYEFAVSSVDSFGIESDLHTSLDETARPGAGWYLEWLGT